MSTPRSLPLTIVSGTNRPGSTTRRVAVIIQQIYAGLGETVHLLDLATLPPAVFKPECYAKKPPAFRPWSTAIIRARGLIIVTPEYNGGMPGVLKYFIDLLPFPESLHRKPVCFVGVAAGRWGALRPVEQLSQIFTYRQAHLYPERVFLPDCDALFAGGRLGDAETIARLQMQAASFRDFCGQISPAVK